MFSYRGDNDYFREGRRAASRATTTVPGTSSFKIVVTLILLVVAGLAVYFLYNLLFGAGSSKNLVTLVSGQVVASPQTAALPAVPPPYEGGEYTVSLWVYVNSYNTNTNNVKHIIDIGGNSFSTVLIGLGANKNTIIVRTDSHNSGSTPGNLYGATNSYGASTSNTNRSYQTPPSLQDGSLTTDDITALLNTQSSGNSLLDADKVCDLNEFDLQRWTLVTVILSGRSIDVYLDGKLSRSCITESYYKVDTSGPVATMFRSGSGGVGFDGYISKVQVANIGLNPSDIYKIYSNGP